MSTPGMLSVKALSAYELYNKFMEFGLRAFPEDSVRVRIESSVKGLTFEVVDSMSNLGNNPSLKHFVDIVREHPYIGVVSGFVRLGNNDRVGLLYEGSDALVARITIDGAGEVSRLSRLIDAAASAFRIQTLEQLVVDTGSVIDVAASRVRDSSIAELQETSRKLVTFLSELAMRERRARADIEQDMEASFQQRKGALEAQLAERELQIKDAMMRREEAISQREREHLETVAQFNTHESKYARRDLQRQLEELLRKAEVATLSPGTAQKRWYFHVSALGLLLFLGSVAGISVYKILTSATPDWHFFAPLTAGVVGFSLTMIYYMKWHDRWFREHADAEFAAKRYKADVLRASWIAELIHEWAKDGKGEIPKDVIDSFTFGLFRDASPSRVDAHPLEDITSLVKRATRIDIGKGTLSIQGPSAEEKS